TLVRKRGFTSFLVKRHEILDEKGEGIHVLGLVPVYPTTGDLSVRTIRNALHHVAPVAWHLVDPLPARLLAARRYPSKAEALWSCHFPRSEAEARRARERLAFEELLLLQVALLRRRQAHEQRKARALPPAGDLTRRYLADLPYRPTGAQRRVIAEIEQDLARNTPMQRLLHGDVGSGKTMVAAYCLLRAVEAGGQGALMAPTEVLADQHFLRLQEQLGGLGVKVCLIKGKQTGRKRKAVLRELKDGQAAIAVGTHALIQEGVNFRDLQVVVVDEQHRFGVHQREALVCAGTGGFWPHTLHMSATPIPRTLSLTVYGDLDVSVLDEMPPGRQPVRTRLVFKRDEARMWRFVRSQLEHGRQAYVVCPLIEESESLQAASARQTFAELAQGELAGFRLRLLHGQLPPAEKAAAMTAYARGEVDVLVSTAVIEVGVDVANASVMVILGARRFGLSQLHQLRGRVGRGTDESYCFLVVDTEDEAALDRLALFARTTDGFALAEADLVARGEGQLFGERQSGRGDLQVASLLRDRTLLEEARQAAHKLLQADFPVSGEGDGGVDVASGSPAAVRVDQSAVLRLLWEEADRRFGDRITWMERA
ncbi:MAG: ATP-dependent DNA helicase RecG, partial [Thermoleophilia bacterium]|nr:ATP-dependent DNA helicase RecG [Thermoleophilia bacterium]